MEKKEKNEEIQSRREFFKNAVKKALPFIGAVALTSNPLLAKDVEDNEPSGCDFGCTGGCSGSCGRACSSGCSGSCAGSCSGECKGYCQGSCKGSCSGSCRGYSD